MIYCYITADPSMPEVDCSQPLYLAHVKEYVSEGSQKHMGVGGRVCARSEQEEIERLLTSLEKSQLIRLHHTVRVFVCRECCLR